MPTCEICGRTPTEKHHLFSRGAWCRAALVPQNEINLCADHHRLDGKSAHNFGRDRFAELHGLEERVEKARVAVQGKVNERYCKPCFK